MVRFDELDGRWYCLEARRPGETNSDYMVRWLTDAEAEALKAARAAGLGEEETFFRVFPDRRERTATAPPEPPPTVRVAEVDGTIFVVSNPEGGAEDAAVWRPLTPEQAQVYRRRRARGEKEAAIVRDLLALEPPATAAPRKVTLDVGRMSKEQLLQLIELKLGTKLPSLQQSSREDLERLVLGLPG